MSKVNVKNLINQVLENPEWVQQLIDGSGQEEGTIKVSDLRKMSGAEIANLLAAQEEAKPRRGRPRKQAEEAPKRRGRPPGSKNNEPKPRKAKGGARGFWGADGPPTTVEAAEALLKETDKPRKITALQKIIANLGGEPPPKGGQSAPPPEPAEDQAPPKGVREHVLGRIKSPPTLEAAQAMLRSAQHQRGDNKKPRLVAALQSLIEEFKEVQANLESKAAKKLARQARSATRASAQEVVGEEQSSSKRVAHG